MSQNRSMTIAQLEFRVDHVCVAVPALKSAIESYEALFGNNVVSGPFDDPIQKGACCVSRKIER